MSRRQLMQDVLQETIDMRKEVDDTLKIMLQKQEEAASEYSLLTPNIIHELCIMCDCSLYTKHPSSIVIGETQNVIHVLDFIAESRYFLREDVSRILSYVEAYFAMLGLPPPREREGMCRTVLISHI